MRGCDERAHVEVVRLGGVAPAERADLLREPRDEAVVDGRTGDDARGRRAVLARVPVAPEADVLDRTLEVGVVEDDDRRLAAELEVEALDRVRGVAGDALARLGIAGDRHHGHGGMEHQRVADGLTGAGDDVEDAGRQDVGGDLRQHQGVSGVRIDGLRMTVLPAASAGPIFQPAM